MALACGPASKQSRGRTWITHRMEWGATGQKAGVSLGTLPKCPSALFPYRHQHWANDLILCPSFSKRALFQGLSRRNQQHDLAQPLTARSHPRPAHLQSPSTPASPVDPSSTHSPGSPVPLPQCRLLPHPPPHTLACCHPS